MTTSKSETWCMANIMFADCFLAPVHVGDGVSYHVP